jgi:hypothetical protein
MQNGEKHEHQREADVSKSRQREPWPDGFDRDEIHDGCEKNPNYCVEEPVH